MEAEQALARQRQDSARSVADAESALAEARRAAARQQEDSERSLARVEAEPQPSPASTARRDVLKAKRELQDAEKTTARVVKDAAAEVREAEEGLAADAPRSRPRHGQGQPGRDASPGFSWAPPCRITTDAVPARAGEAGPRPGEVGGEPDLPGGPGASRDAGRAGQARARAARGWWPWPTDMSDVELREVHRPARPVRRVAGRQTFAREPGRSWAVLAEIARQHGQAIADRVRDGMDGGRNNVYPGGGSASALR